LNVEAVKSVKIVKELKAIFAQRRRFDPFDKLRAGRDAEDEKMWSVIRGRVSARKIQMSVFTQGHRFH
jgi:hypothetical protein